ncbi:MAG: hypothetical protein F6K26_31860 [Moorea sp. SIO2I5]|nr:hypothetical protein [Moorena sp. SIO2I5]
MNLGLLATRSPLARLRPLATLRERRSLKAGLRPSRSTFNLPTFNLPTFNFQPSTCQPSTCQPSTFNLQPITYNL